MEFALNYAVTRLRRRPDWQKSSNTSFTIIADKSTKVNDNI